MAFNIRYDEPKYGIHAWPNRQTAVLEMLNDYDVDVFGLQEALDTQLEYIAVNMPQYAWVGRGRQAGGGGEYNPIFYKSTYTLLDF